MKKIFALFMFIISFSCFASDLPLLACPKSPPTNSPSFCDQFKAVASCHCQADGHLPASLCADMNVIYKRMLLVFKTQASACRWQEKNGSPSRTTSAQCMKDWDCYRLGAGACYSKCI
ncbi:hypothetical protein N9L02_02045 [Gammaproteobacteria bacterium]|nr:hypothetical protein [Gammaproteobacteria bacterium]